METPDIDQLFRQDLLDLGYPEGVVDELMVLAKDLGDRLRKAREINEAKDKE